MVEEAKQSLVARLIESVVTLVIFLVIVQTFLEDFAVVADWTEDRRRILLISGFFFDLFFTVEFLARLYNGLIHRRALRYFVYERGWIDFLASIPLLIFSSGPPMLAYLFDEAALVGFGGILNMLKLVKAIRIARILRLLRIVKIFRSLKYAESPMAQRHLAKIITISITVIVLCLGVYSVLDSRIESIGADTGLGLQEKRIVDHMQTLDGKGIVTILTQSQPATPQPATPPSITLLDTVLLVKVDGKTIFSRYDQDYYRENLFPGDYVHRKSGSIEVYFDRRGAAAALDKNQSWQSLFFFAIVLLMVFSYLFFYSPHFAFTVTDPIHVMKRGLSEKDYNLEVKILELYEADDVFQLADHYNNSYLPLKDRSREKSESAGSELKLDDIKEILE